MAAYNSIPDVELTELLRLGDNAAFTEIYNRYHAALYIHAFNKLRNREEGRDIVHDLFASLWNNHSSLQIKTTLSAYLYTAVRYKIFDFISQKYACQGDQ